MAIHKVEVHLREIPYEQWTEAQRRAWDWLWREWMKRTDQSYRPQLPRGGRVNRRRGRGVSNIEHNNDTPRTDPASSNMG
jgi:hypothetical protein